MKQDIWSWKIFPYEIFIRCISWRAKICRKDFNIVESLEFKKCVAIYQFSIYCYSNKSLTIIHIMMIMILYLQKNHLSIECFLFNIYVVPVIKLNIEIEPMEIETPEL